MNKSQQPNLQNLSQQSGESSLISARSELRSNNKPVYVTKSIIPDPVQYAQHIMHILETRHLTNIGRYVTDLEKRLCSFLNIPNLVLCSNGTLSLQLAFKAFELSGKEVITTPFSYVASVSALLWEQCIPVFADIDEETLCLNPNNLNNALSDNTKAILPVHIFGNACDVDQIASFAANHKLQTIYDAAQAFGCTLHGKSLLSYGDCAITSFHATKVFHTIEGGGIVCHDKQLADTFKLLRSFGHIGDTHYTLGINAKMTEPNAAMGLCLLDKVRETIAERKRVSLQYDSLFPKQGLRKPTLHPGLDYNYSYYPVIFDTNNAMLNALEKLNQENIYPRRYFFPALNTLPYLKKQQSCPVAEDVCARVLGLPLYAELEDSTVERIMRIVNKCL